MGHLGKRGPLCCAKCCVGGGASKGGKLSICLVDENECPGADHRPRCWDSAGYARPLIPRLAVSGMGEVVILKGVTREGNTEM